MEIYITLVEGKDFHKDMSKECAEELCKHMKARYSKHFSKNDYIDVRYRRYRKIDMPVVEKEWNNEMDNEWNNA